nr:MAG: baculoviral IAP repeat-containing protein [Marsupenaeus japonicus endogenous nimavirus]
MSTTTTCEESEICPKHIHLEQRRVETFINQFNENIDEGLPIHYRLLAKAGFFYMKEDVIACFCCKLQIDVKTLRTSDDIIMIHKKSSPGCMFAQNLYSLEDLNKYCKPPQIHKTFFKYARNTLIYEQHRLETFADWPHDFVSPIELAADGFYFLKKQDHVMCVFCVGILGLFEMGDIVREKHKHAFPGCAFVRGDKTCNIPAVKKNIFEKLSHEYKPPKQTNSPLLDYIGVFKYNISSVRFKRDTLEKRLASFKDWPEYLVQKPQDLAEAGFYYCGLSDHVACFHCEGGILNWERNDIPWHEHAKYYPTCNYLYLKKGKNFIDNIRLKISENTQYESFDEMDLLMELDIVRCIVSIGYSINDAKCILKKHVTETGWPYLSIEPYILDINQMILNRPVRIIPKPPSIIRHLVSERMKSLLSISESASSSTTVEGTDNNISQKTLPEADNMETLTSQEIVPEADNTETFTFQEIYLPEAKNTETSTSLKKSHEHMYEDRICKVCMSNEASVVYFPCTHMIACEDCTLALEYCPICRKDINYVVRPIIS